MLSKNYLFISKLRRRFQLISLLRRENWKSERVCLSNSSFFKGEMQYFDCNESVPTLLPLEFSKSHLQYFFSSREAGKLLDPINEAAEFMALVLWALEIWCTAICIWTPEVSSNAILLGLQSLVLVEEKSKAPLASETLISLVRCCSLPKRELNFDSITTSSISMRKF